MTFNKKIYIVQNVRSFCSTGKAHDPINCEYYWKMLNNSNGFDWKYSWKGENFIERIKDWEEFNDNKGDNGPWIVIGSFNNVYFKSVANKKDFARSTLVRTIKHYFGL